MDEKESPGVEAPLLTHHKGFFALQMEPPTIAVLAKRPPTRTLDLFLDTFNLGQLGAGVECDLSGVSCG